MELVQSLGEIGSRFLSIRILHPLAKEAFEKFDAMRDCRRLGSLRNEQPAGTFFAESQAGKSTTIKMYLETKVVDDCLERGLFPPGTPREVVLALQKLVVYIDLPPATRMKPLMTEILKALDDPRPDYGNIESQMFRAEKLMKALGVELLIFDEIDHLRVPLPRSNSKREEATSVHNFLKTMLLKGYPVMFVGIPEARMKLFSEKQMERREMYEIRYDALDYHNPTHQRWFLEYVANLGISLQEKGIMKERSDFISGDILPCLFVAGGSLLGGASRTVWRAAELAFKDGAKRVERGHLARATEAYSIPKYCDYNPFTQGLRDTSLPRQM